MEAIFRYLCDMHGLRSIGTTFSPKRDHVTVWILWGDKWNCASGEGKTFDAALADAVEAKAKADAPVECAA